MIELDSVERALESENTEWADRMAFLYVSTIELATSPFSDKNEVSLRLHANLRRLHDHGNRIASALHKHGLLPIYQDVISQVRAIQARQQGSGSVE